MTYRSALTGPEPVTQQVRATTAHEAITALMECLRVMHKAADVSYVEAHLEP